MKIRNLLPNDREQIKNILIEVKVFKNIEVDCALELIDIALNNPRQQDYIFKVAVNEIDRVLGYICYGHTPLTEGVYDMYWIVLNPSDTRQGIGSALFEDMKDHLLKESARMILAETSSLAHYAQARNFYKKHDFYLAGEIKDFYFPGDNKLIFRKDL